MRTRHPFARSFLAAMAQGPERAWLPVPGPGQCELPPLRFLHLIQSRNEAGAVRVPMEDLMRRPHEVGVDSGACGGGVCPSSFGVLPSSFGASPSIAA